MGHPDLLIMESYSVLTTVYSKEKPEYLRQCLESMVNQTIPPNEYVIVEDGPLGNELEDVIEEYKEKYPFFKIIKLKDNSGCGVASIAGMESCSFDLVVRIDSDDISIPERCEIELAEFENDHELVVVGSDMYEFEGDISNIVSLKTMPYSFDEIYKFGKRRNPFNHSTVMMRRSVVQSFGGYAPIRRSLDLDLFTKLVANKCKCKNLDKPLVYFRTGQSRIKRKKNWTNLKCDLSVYKRNYRIGYINFFEYIIIAIRQFVFFIMPSRLAEFLHTRLFRKKAPSKKF